MIEEAKLVYGTIGKIENETRETEMYRWISCKNCTENCSECADFDSLKESIYQKGRKDAIEEYKNKLRNRIDVYKMIAECIAKHDKSK